MDNSISEKQLEANRANAQLGGIKTEEGKQISKYNALKHGILQQSLTEYEENLYPHILEDLIEQLKPIGFLETVLVERIAIAYLRLFRVAKVEKEFMQSTLDPRVVKTSTDELLKSLQGEDTVVNEGYTPQVGMSVVTRLENTILRYETSIERSLYKALHEFQRLQASRNGEKPPLPVALDINLVNDSG